MKGKVLAFYGTRAKNDDGTDAGTIKNHEVVTIIAPFGKPAKSLGEWVKVKGSVTGWVNATQVITEDYA